MSNRFTLVCTYMCSRASQLYDVSWKESNNIKTKTETNTDADTTKGTGFAQPTASTTVMKPTRTMVDDSNSTSGHETFYCCYRVYLGRLAISSSRTLLTPGLVCVGSVRIPIKAQTCHPPDRCNDDTLLAEISYGSYDININTSTDIIIPGCVAPKAGG